MTSSNHEGNSIKIKYQTVETVPKSNRKIVERDKIDTPNQGRIQDFKLGEGALKQIAPSRGRREHFLGYFVWKITILPPKNHIFSNFNAFNKF